MHQEAKEQLRSISKITQLPDAADSSKSEELTAALVKWCINHEEGNEKKRRWKLVFSKSTPGKEKKLVDLALRPNDSDSLLGEVWCVDESDS